MDIDSEQVDHCRYDRSVIRDRSKWLAGRISVVAAVVAVSIGLFIHVLPWLGAGLGYSDDGYNAAMWSLGARGGIEDPVGNRMGGVQPDGTEYAHHPPLLVWSIMPVTAISDDWTLGLRLVPFAASVASMGFLAMLLLDAGASRIATAAGVVLAGSAGMFLTYGAMVDTPVFSFPFALAAVWASQRSWQSRPPPTAAIVAIGVLTALSGWQALLVAVLAATVAALRPLRESRKAASALIAGTAAGAVIDLLWIWWVTGSLSDLLDSGTFRSTTAVGIGKWLDMQRFYADDGFGTLLLLVVLAGTIAILVTGGRSTPSGSAWVESPESTEPLVGATIDGAEGSLPRSRWTSPLPLLAVFLPGVIGYALLFRQAAVLHAYWNYFGIAIVGVTGAALVDTCVTLTRPFSPRGGALIRGLIAVAVLTIAGFGFARRGISDHTIRRGLDVVPLVQQLPTAPDPRTVVVATVGGVPEKPWLDWSTRGHHEFLDLGNVSDLPANRPVLLTLPDRVPASTWAGSTAQVSGRFVLIPAGELAKLMTR